MSRTFFTLELFVEDELPLGFEEDEVEGGGADFDDFAGFVDMAGSSAEEAVLGGVEDEIVVFKVGDMEESFQHQVAEVEVEAERFDAGDSGLVDGMRIFLEPFVEESELFQDLDA